MDNIITVIIHTYENDAQNNYAIISAKSLTSNVIIYGMTDSPETVSLAAKYDCRYYRATRNGIVETVRNDAIAKVKTDWFFLLDADEEMTPELAAEIIKRIKSEEYSYYKVPRKEILLGKTWLRHGGWWPNHQIRLIRTGDFVDWPATIHSTPKINGKMGYLSNCLLHYSQNDFGGIVDKTLKFESQESDLLYQAGRSVKTATFFRKFGGELFRRMIRRLGFRDGTLGIIESIYQAYSKTITWLLLYEKKHIIPTEKKTGNL